MINYLSQSFRGSGCVNYALYQNSKFYGCTAHIIDEKIDNGKIIDVRKFKITRKDSVSNVLKKTYKTMSSSICIDKKYQKKTKFHKKKQILKNKNLIGQKN